MLESFPYILFRICGESISCFSTQLLELGTVKNLSTALKSHSELKAKIDVLLFDEIGSTKDSRKRKKMLELKRSLRADYYLPSEHEMSCVADEQLKAKIKEYIEATISLKTLRDDFSTYYCEEIEQMRNVLLDLASSPNFLNGLLLSSSSLYYSIIKLNQNRNRLDKKRLSIERSILKYLTRMFAKTSPFSTFTQVTSYNVSQTNGNNCIIKVPGIRENVPSGVRLNNQLFQYLKQLLYSDKDIAELLGLRINPTLQLRGEQYTFLTNHNNVEAFQNVLYSPSLEIIVRIVSSRHICSVRDVVNAVFESNIISASREELTSYLFGLVECGLIEFDLGISGIDPDWDMALSSYLQELHIQNDEIIKLCRVLKMLRALSKDFKHKSIEERESILRSSYELLRDTCLELHESFNLPSEERMLSPDGFPVIKQQAFVGPQLKEEDIVFRHKYGTKFIFYPEQIWYEDVEAQNVLPFSKEYIDTITKSLSSLVNGLRIFEYLTDEEYLVRSFLSSVHIENDQIGLLQFYEEFYRLIQNTPDNDRVKLLTDKADNLKRIRKEAQHSWCEKFIQVINDRLLPDLEHINIYENDIRKANTGYNLANNITRANSYSAFIQCSKKPLEESYNKKYAVLNGITLGYGKMFSRFTHIFDESVEKELRTYNAKYSGGRVLVENRDGSYFNANIHKPLCDYEISFPGAHSTLESQYQIPVKDLVVEFSDKVDSQPILRNRKSGDQYCVLDLGFQGEMGRSNLFRLLNIFCTTRHVNYRQMIEPINAFVNQMASENANINYKRRYPRVIYEDFIVLQRQAWVFEGEKVPQRDSYESASDYFIAINRWRFDLRIPDSVFIKIVTNRNGDDKHEKGNFKVRRDDYKPQYIHFNSPMLVELFGDTLSRAKRGIFIEEMLPKSEDLFEDKGDLKFVNEILTQWYEE